MPSMRRASRRTLVVLQVVAALRQAQAGLPGTRGRRRVLEVGFHADPEQGAGAHAVEVQSRARARSSTDAMASIRSRWAAAARCRPPRSHLVHARGEEVAHEPCDEVPVRRRSPLPAAVGGSAPCCGGPTQGRPPTSDTRRAPGCRRASRALTWW